MAIECSNCGLIIPSNNEGVCWRCRNSVPQGKNIYDDGLASLYDEDCDFGQGMYLSDGMYLRADGSIYDEEYD